MKIPVEWLLQYIKTERSSKELASDFTMIGLLLDKPVTSYEADGYKTDVLDLEHRMDRSDWLSVLGCARDLSAYLSLALTYPEVLETKLPEAREEDKIAISVDCPDLVNRFNTLVFKNIKVKPSPPWLKNRLESYGIPSINNIVDITNYVLVEYGQPMHAQDISKLKAKEIHIRRAKNGETLTTFLGENLKLTPDNFVLTQAGTPTVLGGIVGGIDTGVDESTTSIVLDAGNYDQVNIRKSSRQLKIQNETVLRYDKFLHPKLTEVALQRAAKLILEVAGGEAFFNYDYISPTANLECKSLNLTKARLDLLAGEDFDFQKAANILTALEYVVTKVDENMLHVEVPYFRTDVVVEDDVASDILRINGYDKIKPQKLTGEIPPEVTPLSVKFIDELKNTLTQLGLNEYITAPMVKYSNRPNQIKLGNSVNQDQDSLRTNLYETLEPIIQIYAQNAIHIVGIFEIGKAYSQQGTQYQDFSEDTVLQVVTYPKNTPLKTSLDTKTILSTLMHKLGISFSVNGKNEILLDNVPAGEITYDGFSLKISSLMAAVKKNLVVKDRVENFKTRELSLSMASDVQLGVAITELRKKYPQIVTIEVLEESLLQEGNTKTIGLRLFFEESTVDANSLVHAILIELKQVFGIDNRNLA